MGERLRRLDDRVLGPPRLDSAATMRTVFLLALLGVAAVVVLALVTGRGSMLAAGGGFLGVMLTTGIRWRWASRSAQR